WSGARKPRTFRPQLCRVQAGDQTTITYITLLLPAGAEIAPRTAFSLKCSPLKSADAHSGNSTIQREKTCNLFALAIVITWRESWHRTCVRASCRRRKECKMGFKTQLNQVLRRLSRTPLFTAVTLITLAAGVGANTVVFSVLESILLKPLRYP